MKQTKAPKKTPSPKAGDSNPHTGVGQTGNQTTIFVSMALDMSWRLAIVVLIPIIGGFELDQHFSVAPLWTITGFLLAMVGMAAVMWQTLQAANKLEIPSAVAPKSATKSKKATKAKKPAKGGKK